MEKQEFKKLFGIIAKENNFISAFGGWFKKSEQCIVTISLQKSSFSNTYYLNVNTFIENAFSKIYVLNKDLIKSSAGHLTQQIRDLDILDLDILLNLEMRIQKLQNLFLVSVNPFVNLALTRKGIYELEQKGEIFILPAVKEELERLDLIN